MNFSVTVLPFDLEPPPLEYALYYRGAISSAPEPGITSEWKTPDQYASELQDMKDHGVGYPTMISENAQLAGTELSLRNQAGLPADHIYLLGIGTGNATSPADLATLRNQVVKWKNIVSQYGYQDVYFYGIDEARDEVLQSERPAWQTVKENGGKVYVAVSDNPDAVTIAGDLLDLAVFAGPLNTTQAAEWHRNGHKIFSYANPQVGVENPEIYRQNYGFALWNAGYDGAMDYAYQHSYGQIWNDFDRKRNRDHVFAYPTSDGVIDTIQWEGWREGVDDTRYLATLIKREGSETSARAIISDSLSRGEDMATIREKIIALILNTSSKDNGLPEMGIYRNGVWYLGQERKRCVGSWHRFPVLISEHRAGLPVVGDWNGDGENRGRVSIRTVNGTWTTMQTAYCESGTDSHVYVRGDRLDTRYERLERRR